MLMIIVDTDDALLPVKLKQLYKFLESASAKTAPVPLAVAAISVWSVTTRD